MATQWVARLLKKGDSRIAPTAGRVETAHVVMLNAVKHLALGGSGDSDFDQAKLTENFKTVLGRATGR